MRFHKFILCACKKDGLRGGKIKWEGDFLGKGVFICLFGDLIAKITFKQNIFPALCQNFLICALKHLIQ